ncbi:MAG: NUDIX domain-containing protein [Patescibacteria group bacterium]
MEGQQIPRPSAGGIVVNPGGKLLIVQQHNNSWSFPKGGVNEGEGEYDAALREIREETGLTELELVGSLGSYERYSIGQDGIGETKEWGSRRRTFFLFTTAEELPGAFNDPDGEITAVQFVTLDEALTLLTHPKDKEFLASVRSKIEQ